MTRFFLELMLFISLITFFSCNKGGITGEYLLTNEMRNQNQSPECSRSLIHAGLFQGQYEQPD